MKLFVSLFLLIIMIASVTVPVLVQWQAKDVSELKEGSANDGDDTLKIGEEKEMYTFNGLFLPHFTIFLTAETSQTQYQKHDRLISENHALLPELPPEA